MLLNIIRCEDTIADDLDTKIKLAKAADYIMKGLSERERKIIMMRYGLADGKGATQQEVAKRLGISRSYVSRIEKSALEKIRAVL